MSDDEFYYDDDDDWYWYEDDNMGLGDELAENAIHSPIMVEDPSLETVDTYSDWEYYSDDYYDDDPTVTTKQETNGERRKKRRKLSSIENIPSLSLGSSIIDPSTSMADSFKGVLWKVPVKGDEKIELYEPGKGEKVALLSDWRELFNAPLYREAWFTNGSKAAGNETDNDDRNGLSIDRAKATSTDTKYGRYSPPPLAIDNLDKTISRQREKLSQPELQNAPEQLPAEMMIVADSEEEDEELDETILDPMAVTEVDTAEDDKENNVVSEKEEQFPRQMSIRVEIPTLAAAMKQDALNQSTTPRKRGRKPKASFASAEQGSTSGNSATKQTPTTTKRKRVLTTDKEEQEEEDSKRRSKRVATSTSKKATGDGEPDKKNTRASSMASPREERRKRRRI